MVRTYLKSRTQKSFETGNTRSSLEQRPASVSLSPDITQQSSSCCRMWQGKVTRTKGDQLQVPRLRLIQLLGLPAALGSMGLQHRHHRFNCPERQLRIALSYSSFMLPGPQRKGEVASYPIATNLWDSHRPFHSPVGKVTDTGQSILEDRVSAKVMSSSLLLGEPTDCLLAATLPQLSETYPVLQPEGCATSAVRGGTGI